MSQRLTGATVGLFADPGTHAGRLVGACWQLGADREYAGLRRWAHMLGFAGHFSTKSRAYSTTLRALRMARRAWRRRREVEETTLVVGDWSFAGIGWRTTADAVLATTAAALARERRRVARDEISRIREELV